MKLTRQAHRLPFRGLAPLLLASALPLGAIAAPPPEAAAEGYTVNTYSSNFTSQTVDLNNTRNRGYKWYLYNLFGKKASPSGVHLNGDGSVTFEGDNSGALGQLMSVSPYPGTDAWVGIAFGGGMYVESVMAFSVAQVVAGHVAHAARWPSFWSLAMEGNFIAGNQWPGQASGYEHNVELDWFEADMWWKPQVQGYGSGLHDWYGIRNKTCSPGVCEVSMDQAVRREGCASRHEPGYLPHLRLSLGCCGSYYKRILQCISRRKINRLSSLVDAVHE